MSFLRPPGVEGKSQQNRALFFIISLVQKCALNISIAYATSACGLTRWHAAPEEMSGEMKAQELDQDLEQDMLRMTADIVAAYVSANAVQTTQLPELIRSVIGALASLQGGASTGTPVTEPPQPPVPIRKSVTPDYIICLEDGRKLKMLKRHLRTSYNMSPAEYRAKWGLPAEYPMVAPNYAARRSDFAKQIGLGRTAAERPKRRRAGH